MKRIFSLSIITVLVVSQYGCDFTTLYPIFTVRDIVFKPGLLGFWKPSKKQMDSDYLEIEKLTNISLSALPEPVQKISAKGYLITKKDVQQNIISRHVAFLVKIGSNLYFDLYPIETEVEKSYNGFFKDQFVKMHSIYRVDMKENDRLELREFDGEFIKKLINTKQIRIRHEQQPNMTNVYIITAPTEELQAYLVKYADNPMAYAETSRSAFEKLH